MSSVSERLIKEWKGMKKRPKVIVFDLDYTVWPYYIDCHAQPPISKKKVGKIEKVVDSQDFDLSGFEQMDEILTTLRKHCLTENEHLAVASRSTTPDLAKKALSLLGWLDYFSSVQIYPTSKVKHMNQIKEDLKFDSFKDVLFFDDEPRNIIETRHMGVTAIEVNSGFGANLDAMIHGFNQFNSKK